MRISDWSSDVCSSDLGYAGIFILMFLENVFPPIPSEVIMGLGGIAVAQGRFDFWTLVAVAVAGTTAGNWSWYAIGRWIGYERLRPFIDRPGRWLALHLHAVDKMHDFLLKSCPQHRTEVRRVGIESVRTWRYRWR